MGILNYETILSSYDDKLTLMQWLKKVEDALNHAAAVSFNVNKRGNATLTFSVVFEDGSEIESGPIVLEQGESVESAAIENGRLILTLTNGDTLDAGDLGGVSSFSIDASQHLIVHYQNGTSQDLGNIFDGNIAVSGDFTAKTIRSNEANVLINILPAVASPLSVSSIYSKAIVNNNILYLIFNYKVKNESASSYTVYNAGVIYVTIPAEYAQKVIDMEGNSIAQAISSPYLITIFKAFHCNDNLGANEGELICKLVNSSVANQATITITKTTGLTFAANEEKYFTGRAILTLY